MSKLIMTEEGSTPSTPTSGKWTLYFKSDGLYFIEDTGAVIGPLGQYPTGFLHGLTLSNNVTDATNDIDIATGKCRDSADGANMVLGSALTKRLDATWAVGTNQGGLDTGAIANGTYHIWLIKRPDTGVVDALFSLSASAPTMPTNYTLKRRIGSIVRTGAAIKGFVQDGDKFMWKVPVNDLNVTNPGTAAATRTLTLPTGIRIEALIIVQGVGNTSETPGAIYISDLSVTDSVPTFSGGIANFQVFSSGAQMALGGPVNVMTNTSAQVRSRVEASAASTVLRINTNGWIDTRSRLS